MNKLSMLRALVLLSVAFIVPVTAQQNGGSTNTSTKTVASGSKMDLKGMIVKHDQGTILVRDQSGSDTSVKVGSAKIEEKKSNPLRGAKKYGENALVRGLYVEVEGRGDGSGNLAAEKIKFSNDDYKVANSVESTVVPVEHRLGEAEDRVSRTEENAKRLSGQIDELT